MKEIILIFAAWRLTSLIVNEDGPFDILAKFRKFIGVYYDEFGRKQGKNVLAKLLTCVWCASVWIALAISFFSDNSVNIHTYLIEAFFISAGVIILDELVLLIERHEQ